jgi:hypothetical protein
LIKKIPVNKLLKTIIKLTSPGRQVHHREPLFQIIKPGNDPHVQIKGDSVWLVVHLSDFLTQIRVKLARERVTFSLQRSTQLAAVNSAARVIVNVEELVELLGDADEQMVELVEVDLIVVVGVKLAEQEADSDWIELRAGLAASQRFVKLVEVDATVRVVVDVVEQRSKVFFLIPLFVLVVMSFRVSRGSGGWDAWPTRRTGCGEIIVCSIGGPRRSIVFQKLNKL